MVPLPTEPPFLLSDCLPVALPRIASAQIVPFFHELKMVQPQGAKGDAVATYRESFATKWMSHFHLALRVKKTEFSPSLYFKSVHSVFFMKDGDCRVAEQAPP